MNEKNVRSIPELFGSMVFSQAQMRQRLPERVYDAWQQCLIQGTSLDRSIADEIAAAMKESNCHLTRRFSPGEQELDLEYQSVLLDAFRGIPSLSHVRLTESYMLYPEKSMLYLFGADFSNPEISVEHDCSKCPNTSCFFRSTEGPAACL